MLSVGLLSLLLLGSFYGFSKFYVSSTMTLASRQLVQMLRYARQLAIMRQCVITLCGSSDGYHCDGHWAAGRLVIDNHKQRFSYDSGSNNIRWLWRSSFGYNDYLKFSPTGFTLGQQGRFNLLETEGQGSAGGGSC